MAKEQTFAHPPRGHVAILYYDSANDCFRVVGGDGVGHANIRIAAQGVDVEVTQDAPADLLVAAHGYDGATWRKQPLVWGYTERLYAFDTHTKAGAGTYTITVFTVPAGYVYVVNAIVSNDTATAIKHAHQVCDGDDCMTIHEETQSGAGVLIVNANISYPMEAGDKLKVVFTAAQDADYLVARVWGYKMKVNM